ncbi:hypothetical protein L0F63_000096 [Massospora cicadina]|nr:hypothetical protein L0F63_000096 [Massospora cicadina]
MRDGYRTIREGIWWRKVGWLAMAKPNGYVSGSQKFGGSVYVPKFASGLGYTPLHPYGGVLRLGNNLSPFGGGDAKPKAPSGAGENFNSPADLPKDAIRSAFKARWGEVISINQTNQLDCERVAALVSRLADRSRTETQQLDGLIATLAALPHLLDQLNKAQTYAASLRLKLAPLGEMVEHLERELAASELEGWEASQHAALARFKADADSAHRARVDMLARTLTDAQFHRHTQSVSFRVQAGLLTDPTPDQIFTPPLEDSTIGFDAFFNDPTPTPHPSSPPHTSNPPIPSKPQSDTILVAEEEDYPG